MDPSVFMLAPLSMTNAKYQLWRSGIPYTQQVSDELDYEEFNDTHLMPSLTPTVCVLPSYSFPFFLCIALLNDVHMGYSCQAAPIDPPRLLWSVYVYGLNGFARECAIGCNTNVMGYSFLKGTRAVSSLLFLSPSFPFLHPNTCSNTFFFKNLAHYTIA